MMTTSALINTRASRAARRFPVALDHCLRTRRRRTTKARAAPMELPISSVGHPSQRRRSSQANLSPGLRELGISNNDSDTQ